MENCKANGIRNQAVTKEIKKSNEAVTNHFFFTCGFSNCFFFFPFCGHEAKFIQDIVKIKVLEKLNRTMLHAPSYLGGVDAQGKDNNSRIQDRPEE